MELNYQPTFHRPAEFIFGKRGVVDAVCAPDVELARRISAFYKRVAGKNEMDGDGIWEKNKRYRNEMHKVLLSDEYEHLADLLANPIRTELLSSFSYICKSAPPVPPMDLPPSAYSYLLRLGEAWGEVRLENPERYSVLRPGPRDLGMLLDGLEKMFSCAIEFTTPYSGERGVVVERARRVEIASVPAVQQLNHGLMCFDRLGRKNGRVLEIGAGMGRSAQYARAAGITDYTIIDLPIVCVAQAHYLATVLGGDAISLYGEPHRRGVIRIAPPRAFLEEKHDKVDLILNCDSLTEMSFDTMQAYWGRIKTHSRAFLSVNHESNEHTVRELVFGDSAVETYSRHPYWLRRGYVEEYVTFKN